jgi:hypothetical protein
MGVKVSRSCSSHFAVLLYINQSSFMLIPESSYHWSFILCSLLHMDSIYTMIFRLRSVHIAHQMSCFLGAQITFCLFHTVFSLTYFGYITHMHVTYLVFDLFMLLSGNSTGNQFLLVPLPSLLRRQSYGWLHYNVLISTTSFISLDLICSTICIDTHVL